MSISYKSVVAAALLVLVVSVQFAAAGNITIPYNQSFATASLNIIGDANYPAFSDATVNGVGGATITVSGGNLLFQGTGGPINSVATLTPTNVPLPAGQMEVISMNLSGGNNDENYSIQIDVGGGNSFDIYPGTASGVYWGTYASDFHQLNTISADTTYHLVLDISASGNINGTLSDLSNNVIFQGATTGTVSPSNYGAPVALAIYSGSGPAQYGAISDLSITVVPEPSTLVLGALATIGLLLAAARRKRTAATGR